MRVRSKPRGSYVRKRRIGLRRRITRGRRIGRSYATTKYPLYKQLPAIGGFPISKTVRLRYVEDFTLNPSLGGNATYLFRANGVYDPNATTGGHQPMFYDNYTQLYSRYRVNWSTITFIACDTHMVNTTGGAVGITQYYAANERASRMFIIRDQTTSDFSSSLNTLIEEGNRNFKWRFAPQTTTGSMPKLRMSVTPHKLLNLSKRDDSLSALTSTVPLNQCYFIVGVDNMPEKDADVMTYQAIITYNVTFFDLIKNQTQN
nr:MAG: putative capsid protein [Arizlama virus]